MSTLVIDASIAIKWVIEEAGTPAALSLRANTRLLAPDLLAAECANILWKKVGRSELTKDHALLAARLLERSEIELLPTRSLIEKAARAAIELNHPAYDCVYLMLAEANDCRFVTADERLVRKLRETRPETLGRRVVSLEEAAA